MGLGDRYRVWHLAFCRFTSHILSQSVSPSWIPLANSQGAKTDELAPINRLPSSSLIALTGVLARISGGLPEFASGIKSSGEPPAHGQVRAAGSTGASVHPGKGEGRPRAMARVEPALRYYDYSVCPRPLRAVVSPRASRRGADRSSRPTVGRREEWLWRAWRPRLLPSSVWTTPARCR